MPVPVWVCRHVFHREVYWMSKPEARLKSHAKIRENIQSWLIMLPGLLLMTFFV